MTERCPWSDRVMDAAGRVDTEVARHLESCAECAAEQFARDELVAVFRGIARPALSPHFRREMSVRLEKERRRKRKARRRLVALRLYWLAASVVCSAVLANLTLSSTASIHHGQIVFGIGAFVVPIAVLLIAIRTDPFELILKTLTAAAENTL